MARKRFKRYYTGAANREYGKGSDRRESVVSEKELSHNWCRTFGCQPRRCGEDTFRCSSCGADCDHSPERSTP